MGVLRKTLIGLSIVIIIISIILEMIIGTGFKVYHGPLHAYAYYFPHYTVFGILIIFLLSSIIIYKTKILNDKEKHDLIYLILIMNFLLGALYLNELFNEARVIFIWYHSIDNNYVIVLNFFRIFYFIIFAVIIFLKFSTFEYFYMGKGGRQLSIVLKFLLFYYLILFLIPIFLSVNA
jgi:hypothetical protein